MECNRDEANRAKEIAESKFTRKDMIGAKKFALKAQNLYPDLDGISQLVATLDIYIAAENKIHNESDFYGILGVNPLADDDTVRKHYRKLALFLHPDKNKSIGADGAFKYISEAWSTLSDKTKRLSYDQKRNTKVYTQNGGAPSPGQNGFYNFTRSTTTRPKGTTPKDRGTTSTGPTSDKQPKQKTFWTVCHGCKMQYEYLRMYLHQNLLCPNCHEPFLAMETAAPNTKVSTKGFKSQKGRTKSTSQKGESTPGFQWGAFSKTSVPGSSAQAVTMVQQTYEKVKRGREEAQAAVKREEALRRKKNLKRSGTISSGHVNSMKRKQEVDAVKGVSGVDIFDIHTQLVKKARNEIRKKLHELSSKPIVNHKEANQKEIADGLENGDLTKTVIEPLLIEVVDPDFHSFDLKRCETCFKEGDLWAVYDDDDGMPRRHALICKVSSVDPFKLNVCWLNSGTDNAFGEFKIGKNKTVSNTNYFSHKVIYTNLENGIFQVFPRKGEVWALYRNWSPDWNDDTPNDVKHVYEIVEVDEFDEETGFTVTQLLKVAGFKAVFHRHLNRKEARVIPESEIFRFSHQIPSYLLTGREADNAPKGCCELDPAATPDEFLQVIADVQEEPENIDDDHNHDHNDESTVLAEVKEVAAEVKKAVTTNDGESTVLAEVKEVAAEVKKVVTTNDAESTVLAEVKEVAAEVKDVVTTNDDESTNLAEVKEVINLDDE